MIVVEAFDRMVVKVTSEDLLSSWRIDYSHRDTRVQFVNIIIFIFIFLEGATPEHVDDLKDAMRWFKVTSGLKKLQQMQSFQR